MQVLQIPLIRSLNRRALQVRLPVMFRAIQTAAPVKETQPAEGAESAIVSLVQKGTSKSAGRAYTSKARAQYKYDRGVGFTPHPFNKRFAYSDKPFFPIEPRNLRGGKCKRRKRYQIGRGFASGGTQETSLSRHGRREPKWGEGGQWELYKRLPRWKGANDQIMNEKKAFEVLDLSKVRKYIEKGRLDSRFPITQRHLFESRCVTKVRKGISLFNVNDYPFPYKMNIEVAAADQSSIDAIKRVGGTVTVVYLERVNLRAHVKPYKFEVLPRTARPNLQMVNFLEKMRVRGANVRYIKPLWLLQEEERVQTELAEFKAEQQVAEGAKYVVESSQ
eukprot:Platyproteum_vivax@DN6904_c0_g1_i1.p1